MGWLLWEFDGSGEAGQVGLLSSRNMKYYIIIKIIGIIYKLGYLGALGALRLLHFVRNDNWCKFATTKTRLLRRFTPRKDNVLT